MLTNIEFLGTTWTKISIGLVRGVRVIPGLVIFGQSIKVFPSLFGLFILEFSVTHRVNKLTALMGNSTVKICNFLKFFQAMMWNGVQRILIFFLTLIECLSLSPFP